MEIFLEPILSKIKVNHGKSLEVLLVSGSNKKHITDVSCRKALNVFQTQNLL